MKGTGLRVDSDKTQGVFNKRARPKGYVLIWAVGFGSSGSDLMETRSNPTRPFLIGRLRLGLWGGGGAESRRRVSTAGARRTWPKLVVRGSKRPTIGSGRIYVICVMHLASRLGSGRPEEVEKRAVADRRSGARRRAHVRAGLGTRRSVSGVVRVLGVRASPKGRRAWLWHSAGSPPWRSSGGGTPGMVFPLLQWTTGPRI